MLDISLQPVDLGINVPSLRKVTLQSPENESFKLRGLKKIANL